MSTIPNGYRYRKSITLSRASGAVTNYQMKILVGESSGSGTNDVHCNGHCQSTFNDLRFTNAAGTLLDYWIESASGTTPNQVATVWVEFDSIGTTATTFYMYYGNSNAVSASNGDNTFIFFDDFPGTSLDGNKWATPTGNGGGIVSVANSILTILANASAQGETDVPTFNAISQGNIRIGTKNKFVASDTYYCQLMVWKAASKTWTVTPPAQYRWCTYSQTPAWYYLREYTGSAWNDMSTGTTPTRDFNYHIIEINDDGSNKSFFYDGTQYGTTQSDTSETSGYIYLSVWSSSTDVPSHLIDWIRVGQYLATEPAWGAWGVEVFTLPQIAVGNAWKDVSVRKVCISNAWKEIIEMKVCENSVWELIES